MIEFTVNAKPQAKKYRIINTKVNAPQEGPHAVLCECGYSYAAFFGGDSTELKAFRGLVNEKASSAMNDAGLPVMSGPVEIALTIYAKRPLSHYVGGDPQRGVKGDPYEHTPSGIDSMGILEAVRTALVGVVIHTRAQAQRLIATPLYGENDAIRIRVKQYRACEVDARNQQMELF